MQNQAVACQYNCCMQSIKLERICLHDTQAHLFTLVNCNKGACMQVIQTKIQHDNSLKELAGDSLKREPTP